MEIVKHLINDTIEFYKWTLTIAGNTEQHVAGSEGGIHEKLKIEVLFCECAGV